MKAGFRIHWIRTDCGDICGYTPSKWREIVGSPNIFPRIVDACKNAENERGSAPVENAD